jgi:ABC-type branched-subunit amino acid transport system substrate-binding protein
MSLFRIFIIGLLICLPQTAFAARAGCKTLKLGIIVPLSGGLASVGESVRNGALLAKADFDH